MGTTLLVWAMWAFVILALGCLIIWRVDHHAKELLRLKRRSQEAQDADDALDRRERQIEADLAEQTLAERVERRNARLRRQTADANAAAEVAAATIPDRIEAERLIIEADADGRAYAAWLAGMQATISPSLLKELLEHFDRHVAMLLENDADPEDLPTPEDWLRSLRSDQ